MPYRIFSTLITVLLLATQSVYGSDSIDSTSTPSCVIPAVPTNGNNFWNVLAYDGLNTFTNAAFKGYYQAVSEQQPTTIPGTPNVYTFKFKPSLDGWSALQSPSDALASKGAKTDYLGCPVPADNFSIRAKRKGFPCGFYGNISVKNLQKPNPTLLNIKDGFSLRIDSDGDGVTDSGGNLTCYGCEDRFLNFNVKRISTIICVKFNNRFWS